MRAPALALAAAVVSLCYWVAVALGVEKVTKVLVEIQETNERLAGLPSLGTVLGFAAIPLLAVGLRLWFRWTERAALSWAHALEGAAMSAVYWFCATVVTFGLFGGDPAPGTLPPPAEEVYRQEAAFAVVLVIVHAFVFAWWRRRALR